MTRETSDLVVRMHAMKVLFLHYGVGLANTVVAVSLVPIVNFISMITPIPLVKSIMKFSANKKVKCKKGYCNYGR